MKALFTEEEFRLAKVKDKLPCECEECGNAFYKIKHDIQKVYSGRKPGYARFCSKKCQHENHGYRKNRVGNETGQKCKQCNNPSIYYSYETTGDFCSKLCAKTYSSVINKEQKDESLRRRYGNYTGISAKNIRAPQKERILRREKIDTIKGYGNCIVSFCNSCQVTIPFSRATHCNECSPYVNYKMFYNKLDIKEKKLQKANELAIQKLKHLYFDLELSKVDLQRDYKLDTKSVFRFSQSNGIKLRTVGQGLKLAVKNNKFKIVQPYTQQFYKNGFHTGHTGSVMFLRSGYEQIVAKKLDELLEYYEYEKIRIQYMLSGETHTYVSDFYLPQYNIILEPKSDYFFKIKNNKYFEQYVSTTKEYELHYLFDKDIYKFKSINSFEEFYNNNLIDRKYF